MSNRYSHLLSPIKIGNVVLRNRMISSNALPHFLQGPETFPSEQLIAHLTGLAKNGAAVVTFAEWTDLNQRSAPNEDGKRFPMFDIGDPSVQNYICQLVDAIHFYGSKASLAIRPHPPKGYGVCNMDDLGEFSSIFQSGPTKELTEDLMEEMIEDTIKNVKFYQTLGYDMISIHMAYRTPVLAQFLSPLTNKRKDKYGGGIENRTRFPLELCRRVKEACGGDNFLIEAAISGEEKGGTTIEDTVAFAKMAEGKIDILQFRAGTGGLSHPIGINSRQGDPLTLRYSEAVKKSGAKIVTSPIGGYQDLDLNEEFIATGKTDMIAMARAFICDPEYAKKAYEGRGEDVVPCIRCNKCHVTSMTGNWLSVCSVNPLMGIAHKVDKMVDPPSSSKNVAVVGGGPAGMKAAIVAAERGHKVTLYEKSHFLGGQLKHADYSSFKWPLKNYKNFLALSLNKRGVTVLMNTKATPDMIKSRGYDAVIMALGAEPNIPDIPGATSRNVWTPISVYGRHEDLGERIVIVGGSEIGMETGMYLAEKGHKVTVLTRQERLATDATPIHYIEVVEEFWDEMENFSYIAKATTTGISERNVTYIDAEGNEKSIQADSVVVSAGVNPKQDEALEFYGSANQFFIIGDCQGQGDVQKCMRTAFAAASQI